jgi:hypothetical protein
MKDYVNIHPERPVKRSKLFTPNWEAVVGVLCLIVAGCVSGSFMLFAFGLL